MPSEAALCAKAIRKELKENFKGTKFRVTSEHQGTYSKVSIEWEGPGPSEEEVDKVVDRYGTFKGWDALDNSTYVRDESIPQVQFVSLHHKKTG
jgi:hypothetical protein